MALQAAALAAALIALGISIAGLFYAADQIESLNSLIERSNKQLEILNEVLLEAEHQTFVTELDALTNGYQEGSPFNIMAESCTLRDDKIIFILDVLDVHGKPSTIKFEIVIDFVTYTVGGEVGNEYYKIINPQQIIFEPGIQKKTELPLDRILNLTNDTEDPELYLSTQYRFAPYFDKQGSVISDYDLDDKGDLLLGLKKDVTSNEWFQITDNQNIICK